MKKYFLMLFSIVALLVITGCEKEKEVKIPEEKKYISGIIKEIDVETILVDSTSRVHQGEIRVPLRTELDTSDLQLEVGDRITAYYSGKLTKTEPAQISSVYTILITEKYAGQKEELEEQDEQDVAKSDENKSPDEDKSKDSTVPKDEGKKDDKGTKGTKNSENKTKKTEFYNYPLLTLNIVETNETVKLDERQSAFIHDIINTLKWESGAQKDFKAEYVIIQDGETLFEFNSETHFLNDVKNDIKIELHEGISDALKNMINNKF